MVRVVVVAALVNALPPHTCVNDDVMGGSRRGFFSWLLVVVVVHQNQEVGRCC